jgi:hypothetical protein
MRFRLIYDMLGVFLVSEFSSRPPVNIYQTGGTQQPLISLLLLEPEFTERRENEAFNEFYVNTTNLRSNNDVIRETYVEQMTHPELTVRVMSLRAESLCEKKFRETERNPQKKKDTARTKQTETAMTEYYDLGDTKGLVKQPNVLFTEDPKKWPSNILLLSFERLTHDDVKIWLSKSDNNKTDEEQKAKIVVQYIWGNAQSFDDGQEAMKQHYRPITAKLMFYWAKKAHHWNRITGKQQTIIMNSLPNLIPLPEVTTELAQHPESNPGPTTPVPTYVTEYAGDLEVVEEEEEEPGTKRRAIEQDKRYKDINLCLKEAVYYTKTSDVEKQLGGCFTRTQDLFEMHAKAGRAMVDEALKVGSVFAPNW